MDICLETGGAAPANAACPAVLSADDATPRPRVLAALGMTLVVASGLIPLAVLPGLEHPFSTPKLLLLTASTALGAAIAWSAGCRCWPSHPRAFFWLLAAWLAGWGMSALSGELASPASLWLFLAGIGWFFLLMAVRPDPKRLATALSASGVMVAFVACSQFLAHDPFALVGWTAISGNSSRMRVYATLGNPNFVGAFLVCVMPLVAWLGRTPRWRRIAWAALAIQAAAVWATGSRGAVLGLLAGLVWLAAWRQLRRSFAVAAVAVIFALLIWSPARDLGSTINGRFYIWRTVAPHIFERPLLGFGPGAFEPKFAGWEAALLKQSPAPPAQRKFAGLEDHAHNDYLETLTENGALGLVSFLAVLVVFLILTTRQGGLAAASAGGVVSLAAVALVDFPFRRPTELFLFWTLIAMGLLESVTFGKTEKNDPATASGSVDTRR